MHFDASPVAKAQNLEEATARAAVSGSQHPERDINAPIYSSASRASQLDKGVRCCQSTFVALPGALFLVIHPRMVWQLLVPSSGTDLLTP